MKLIAFCASMTLLALLVPSAAPIQIARASEDGTLSVPGLWSGTLFYGDPDNPATPKEQFLAIVNAEGTYSVDSTAATGAHPLNPGEKTEERGTWTRRDRRVLTRGFWFDEAGGGAGFSLGRGVAVLDFTGRDRLAGLADIDFLPCSGGPVDCSDPADVGGLTLGAGVGPFPVVLRRIR
jgi:hypothetical protein